MFVRQHVWLQISVLILVSHKHTSNHTHAGKLVGAARVPNGLPGTNGHVNYISLGTGCSVDHTSYNSLLKEQRGDWKTRQRKKNKK